LTPIFYFALFFIIYHHFNLGTATSLINITMYFSTISITALSLVSVLAGPVIKRDVAFSTASWTGTIAGKVVTFNGTAQALISSFLPRQIFNPQH